MTRGGEKQKELITCNFPRLISALYPGKETGSRVINVMKKAIGRENMKKQSCRMTQQERETHREATKLRKMTDQQLVDYVNSQKEQAGPAKDQEAVHKAEIEELEAEVAKYKAKANKAEAEARKNAENAGRDRAAGSYRRIWRRSGKSDHQRCT